MDPLRIPVKSEAIDIGYLPNPLSN